MRIGNKIVFRMTQYCNNPRCKCNLKKPVLSSRQNFLQEIIFYIKYYK